MVYHGPRRRAINLQNGFSNCREGERNCTIKGYQVWAVTNLHFLHRHIRDTVIILE